MPLAISCLVPHPPIIIPEIGRESLTEVKPTVEAMEKVSVLIKNAKPEVLVFVSPHSLGFSDAFAIKADNMLKGSFAAFGASNLNYKVVNDLELVETISNTSRKYGIDIVKLGIDHFNVDGAGELDHGVLVPIYFISKQIRIPIVVISISYRSYEDHKLLGKIIEEASNKIDKRVALIASGDLSHRLIPGAPAGYNQRAKLFDQEIKKIFEQKSFSDLDNIDQKLIEEAGECGLRSIFVLAGAVENKNIQSEVLSYEGPFGVGYMVAAVKILEMEAQKNEKSDQIIQEIQNAPVKLAKYSLENYLKTGKKPEPPHDTPEELLNRQAGAFVCLKINGSLRGCIGTIYPSQKNLAEEIIYNAIQAATADPRFYPVTVDELPLLSFSVDILSEPEKVSSLNELDPKEYGVIVKKGYRTGLLLPDLDGVDTVEDQLRIAKQKAGIHPSEDADIYKFKVIRYE